jgi:hypothetical protein
MKNSLIILKILILTVFITPLITSCHLSRIIHHHNKKGPTFVKADPAWDKMMDRVINETIVSLTNQGLIK